MQTSSRIHGLAFAAALLPTLLLGQAAHAQSGPPGYRYGDATLPRSPVSLAELDLLKQTVLFTDADAEALRAAGKILVPQTEKILDVWYGFVGAHPHLLAYFADPATGKPDAAYLDRVRARFGRWIADTTAATYDQAWLDWQHEIALRHTDAKKNRTDAVTAAPHIGARYMVAFIYPITATIRPFLEASGQPREEIDKMQAAWTKSVVLQVTLWTQPYVRAGAF